MSRAKKYESVSAMMHDIANQDSALPPAEFDQYIAERKLVKDLAILRSAQGLTQEGLAAKVGRSQSWVSKFENGTDDEVMIGDLRAYMSALGLEYRPGAVKQGATIVDEVKYHAIAIKQKLFALAEITKAGDGLGEFIARFFGETFFNLNNFLSQAAAKLPCAPDKRPYISITTMVEDVASLEHSEGEEDPPRRLTRANSSKRLALN
jgi:transcriptional regulator with XRE-family HTH domain